MSINVRFQVAAILIWLIIIIDYNRNPHLNLLSTKFFKALITVIGFNLAFDLLTVYTITHMDTVASSINRLAHQLFIVTIVLILFLNYVYVYFLAKEQKRLPVKRFLMSMLPLFISIVVIIFGSLTYSVNGDQIYSYGPMAYCIYFCGIIYFGISFYITINKNNALNSYQRGSIQIGLSIWILSLIIQGIFPYLLISGIGAVLMILCTYFSFENQKENYDAVANCFNENAFDRMMTEYYEKGIRPYIISVTISNYDQIVNISGEKTAFLAFSKVKKLLATTHGNNVFHSKRHTLSVFEMRLAKSYLDTLSFLLSEIDLKDVKLNYYITVIPVADFDLKKTEIKDLLSDTILSALESKDGIYYLSQELTDKKHHKDYIESQIATGITNDGFEMFYQPIYCTSTGNFHSAEALLRFKKSFTNEFLSPEEFIPIAEERGLISQLGDRVFEMVASDMMECQMTENNIEYIEVNLSRIQTITPDISQKIIDIIEKYKITPSMLNIEITETASASLDEEFKNNMATLKSDGFSLSMDDFGTGYSNLSQINQADYQLIKLDKSMIWPAFDTKLTEKQHNYALRLLSSTISMLKAMNVLIVAEGVETKEMVDYLTSHEVDYLQGYYFSKPVDSKSFMRFLKEQN